MQDAALLAAAFATGNSDLLAGALLVTALLVRAQTVYALACMRVCVCMCVRALACLCVLDMRRFDVRHANPERCRRV